MDAYDAALDEALQEIEDTYNEKYDDVAEKWGERRVGKYQRGPKKKWPKRSGLVLGGVGGGAATVKV